MKKTFYLLTRPLVWLWKFLTSGLSVLTNLLFLLFVLVVAAVIFYKPVIKVPANCALYFAPNGDIVEQHSVITPLTKLISQVSDAPDHEEIFLQDILDVLNAATDDPRIRMLVINTNRLGKVSLEQLQTIGEAMEEFKRAGKQIVCMGSNFNQAQYYLASRADKIYLNPMGGVQLHGLAISCLYIKDLLDKLDIDVHVFRVGTFKSAVEPLLRNDMSPEDKEANRNLLQQIWQVYSNDIIKYRHLNPETFTENINEKVKELASVGGNKAQLALSTGLVDGLKTSEEVNKLLQKQVGLSADQHDFKHIDFDQYLQTVTPSYIKPPAKVPYIGIISVSGNIVSGKGNMGQIGADDLIKQIRKASRNPRIKAIVLRINTGGGSAFASELIRQELLAAKQAGKVVVVSMGAMTASGGYWLTADADCIVASPTTLTGSIGIFGAIPSLNRSLAQIGIHSDGLGTTDIAQFGNLTSPMSADEQAFMQMQVEQGYKQFINIVMAGRHMKPDAVEKIAEGRVWDGATAQKLGLVDKLGDLQTAIAEAAARAHVSAVDCVFIEKPPENFLEKLQGLEQSSVALIRQFTHTQVLPPSWQQLLTEQFGFLLQSNTPDHLYAHSLLTRSPVEFQ